MPDPIWLDTNVVDRVIKGDIAMERELRTLRSRGHALLMVPAANNELLNGNPLKMKRTKPVWEQAPTPANKVRMQNGMRRLGIALDGRCSTCRRAPASSCRTMSRSRRVRRFQARLRTSRNPTTWSWPRSRPAQKRAACFG